MILKTCIVLYLGLTGPITSQGLYPLRDRLNQLPNTTTEIVYAQGSFSKDCRIRVLGGHSIGVLRALEKAKEKKVDLLIAFDGMGFHWSEAPEAENVINVYSGGWRPTEVNGVLKEFHVNAGHIGTERYHHDYIVNYVKKLQVDNENP